MSPTLTTLLLSDGSQHPLRCDQTIILVNLYVHRDYLDKLRLVNYFDPETKNHFVFLINNFTIPKITLVELYRRAEGNQQ